MQRACTTGRLCTDTRARVQPRSFAALTSMNVGTQKTDEIAMLQTEAEQAAKGRWSFTECPTLKKFLSDLDILHLLPLFNNAQVNYTVLAVMPEERLVGLGINQAMRVIIHEAFGRDVRTRAIAPSASIAIHRAPPRFHCAVIATTTALLCGCAE